MRDLKNNILIMLFLGMALLLLVMIPKVSAQSFSQDGNPYDTASGEVVTAYGTQETLNYKDENLNPKTAVTPETGDETHTVSPESGFSMNLGVPDENVTPGDEVYHFYGVTNEGNTDDTYTLKYYYSTEESGAVNWTVEAYVTDEASPPTFLSTLAAENVFSSSQNLSDDDHIFPYFRVLVPESTLEAPNGSYIAITFTAEASGNYVTGVYQGGNDYYYAGSAEATDSLLDSVAAPLMKLTRTHTVDAPTAAAGYTGGAHDAVPGAVITFTLTYSNEGQGSAESIVIVDKIPDNTKMAHVNRSGASGNVDITAGHGNVTGWSVYYTTEAGASRAYNAAGWVLIGVINDANNDYWPGGATTYVTADAEYEAALIKWQKATVEANTLSKKLTWGVTIR